MDAWIGMIGVVVGVVLGAFAEAIRSSATFKREKRWGLSTDRLGKLESVYMAVEDHRDAYRTFYNESVERLSSGKLSEHGAKVPWARLRMLVNLYTPELKASLAALEASAEACAKDFANTVLQASWPEAERRKRLLPITQSLVSVNKVYDDFVTAIATETTRVRAEVQAATASMNLFGHRRDIFTGSRREEGGVHGR